VTTDELEMLALRAGLKRPRAEWLDYGRKLSLEFICALGRCEIKVPGSATAPEVHAAFAPYIKKG